MEKHERLFAYRQEGILGLLDTLSPDTRVLVTIPGRDQAEMSVEELSRQISELKSSDIGPEAIEKIEVQVMPPPKRETPRDTVR